MHGAFRLDKLNRLPPFHRAAVAAYSPNRTIQDSTRRSTCADIHDQCTRLDSLKPVTFFAGRLLMTVDQFASDKSYGTLYLSEDHDLRLKARDRAFLRALVHDDYLKRNPSCSPRN
ncbi:hypothetical protein MVEN_00642600 [Mycena venus]|uniref:Uncharacterized protein n=1 Tax=Mycena venus TaxID=2733690 RepID=A0A8H6YQC1_9AGAR|nr:hypothetical protein MVEN_00642600 [Mycena venus]